jgi:hypothetical protein
VMRLHVMRLGVMRLRVMRLHVMRLRVLCSCEQHQGRVPVVTPARQVSMPELLLPA